MTNFEQEMINVLEHHVEAEMNGNLELTMSTMTENPHLLNCLLYTSDAADE